MTEINHNLKAEKGVPSPLNRILLTPYPPSKQFYDQLSQSSTEIVETFSVSELSSLGIFGMLLHLRKTKIQHLLIAMEKDEDYPLLPILQIISILSGAEFRSFIDQNHREQSFTRIKIFSLVFKFIGSFSIGMYDALRAFRELRALLNIPRKISTPSNGSILYLKVVNWGMSGTGGASAHTEGVINALVELDQEVIFASPSSFQSLFPHSYFKPIPSVQNFSLPKELNFYRLHYAVIDSFKSTPLDQRPTFIYQRLTLGNWSGVVLSHFMKVPLVVEYNGSEVWIANNWGSGFVFEKLAAMAESACLLHADVIITISDILRDDLMERGVEASRIVVNYNGVDPIKFDPARYSKSNIKDIRESLGISNDTCLVAFIGTFGPWHGVEVLAESIRELHQKQSKWLTQNKVHFLIIGDGNSRPKITETLRECSDFVTFTGFVHSDEAPIYLAASDIFVSPHVQNSDGSAFFGSPTKLFEYLAMGRPIVASNIEQIGKVLEDCPKSNELSDTMLLPRDAQCGVLVNAEDSVDLSRGICFLVDNLDWRLAAGKNARSLAISRHTWKKHVSTILNSVSNISVQD